jgi:hypothetical protein
MTMAFPLQPPQPFFSGEPTGPGTPAALRFALESFQREGTPLEEQVEFLFSWRDSAFSKVPAHERPLVHDKVRALHPEGSPQALLLSPLLEHPLVQHEKRPLKPGTGPLQDFLGLARQLEKSGKAPKDVTTALAEWLRQAASLEGIAAGEDIHEKRGQKRAGRTLAEIIARDYPLLIDEVLDHPAFDPHAQNGGRQTLLHCAVDFIKDPTEPNPLLKKLLDRNHFNHRKDCNGDTPFHRAVVKLGARHLALFLPYVPAALWQDVRVGAGHTAPEWAIAQHDMDKLRLVLDAGCNANNPKLLRGAFRTWTGTVEQTLPLLMEHGADFPAAFPESAHLFDKTDLDPFFFSESVGGHASEIPLLGRLLQRPDRWTLRSWFGPTLMIRLMRLDPDQLGTLLPLSDIDALIAEVPVETLTFQGGRHDQDHPSNLMEALLKDKRPGLSFRSPTEDHVRWLGIALDCGLDPNMACGTSPGHNHPLHLAFESEAAPAFLDLLIRRGSDLNLAFPDFPNLGNTRPNSHGHSTAKLIAVIERAGFQTQLPESTAPLKRRNTL